jgi:hypothetical protein
MNQTTYKTKLVSALSLLSLLLAGSLFGLNTSQAAGLPTVRVVSPDFNPANETFVTPDDLGRYYAAGGRSYFKYVGAGSTITITYIVTSDGTTPAPDKTISFMVNAPWSGSKATWEVDGKSVGASQQSDTGWGLKISGKTNAEGKVSFTIKNTNTAANAMEIPASETQERAGAATRVHGNMKAVIEGLSDMQQVIDLLTFDITKAAAETLPAASTPTPTSTPTSTPSASPTVTAPATMPSMRLISPAYGPTNSVNARDGVIAQYYSAETRAYYTYIPAGTTLTLKYLATSDGTKPLANTEVTLLINSQYSGSKANWLSGSTKAGPSSDSASGAQLKAKTNAAGEVTFVVKNTDTTGTEAAPASANAPAPAIRLYGTFKPVLTGYGDKDADVDLVTFDVYAAAKPAGKATTITCVKSGKASKKVTGVNPKCPAGYKKK